MTEAAQPPIFDRPEPYTATVPLADILDDAPHAARSRTRRSLAVFGALTLPLLQELYEPGQEPRDAEHHYRIIDGHRRIADLREIHPGGEVEAKIVPAEVGGDTAAAMAVALNFGRAPNPVLEAEHFDTLYRQGYDLTQIATMLGISRTKVKGRLDLVHELRPYLRDELRAGRLSVGVAEKLARLGGPVQDDFVEKLESGELEKITGDDVSDAMRAEREGMLPGEPMLVDEAAAQGPWREALRQAKGAGLAYVDAMDAVAELYDEPLDDVATMKKQYDALLVRLDRGLRALEARADHDEVAAILWPPDGGLG